MSQAASERHRTLRSFVRRGGRLTAGQRHALDELLPDYGVAESDAIIDCEDLFGNFKPVILEIGFGNGDSLVQNAIENPDNNYLGIEVHRPGVGHLLMRIAEQGLKNIRVATEDAVGIVADRLKPDCLAGVQIFFPDPWPKKRHHKRRLVQTQFLNLLARVIKTEGGLHLATDWEHYALHMLAVCDAHPAFENTAGIGQYSRRPATRPQTKFERRGERLGHQVYDLLLTKISNQA